MFTFTKQKKEKLKQCNKPRNKGKFKSNKQTKKVRRCSDKAGEGLFRFGLMPGAQTGSPSTDNDDDNNDDNDDDDDVVDDDNIVDDYDDDNDDD